MAEPVQCWSGFGNRYSGGTCHIKQLPAKEKCGLFLTGIGIYVIAILFSDCNFVFNNGIISATKDIDSCLNAYEYPLLMAQVLILSGIFSAAIVIFNKKAAEKFRSNFQKIKHSIGQDNEK